MSQHIPSVREIRFESSRDFAALLQQARVSLLVSTYQAGKLVVLGTKGGQLHLSVHNFEQAMGVAVHPRRIAVGTRSQVWFLESTPEIASALPASEERDGCYLARSCHVTEDIQIHEMAWSRNDLWFVNTRFSCLCTLQSPFSFVPRWQPPFISELAAEDRCHLNGFCLENDLPRFATAMAETNVAGGWREVKATGGCLIDVPSGQTVCRGLAMPHSPRLHQGQLWALDSGRGQVVIVDPSSGQWQPVSGQPGYTRGLDFAGPFAFVGLSRIRETSTFGGVPIAERREQLKCGVAVLDSRSGRHLGHFEFISGVEEIFDVRVLPGAQNPLLAGPLAVAEGAEPIWFVPRVPAPSEPPSAGDKTVGDTTVTHPTASSRGSQEAPEKRPALRLCEEGLRLAESDDFHGALALFDRALQHAPDLAEAHCNRGAALQMLGRLAESAAALRRACALQPDAPASHLNLAMTLFLQAEYREAWSEYEWRWRRPQNENRFHAAAQRAAAWRGEPLAGKTLLLYGEQGIGDEIMFASFVPELANRCGQLIVGCAERLVPLFRRSFPEAVTVDVESLGDPVTQRRLGAIHFQVAAGSVPRVLNWDPQTAIPRPAYLQVDRSLHEAWRQRLGGLGARRTIGISWRGGGNPHEIRRRSTSLAEWRPLIDQQDVAFVNLQYGVTDEELGQFQQLFAKPLHHWPWVDPLAELDGFGALVAALDHVVSIDNSTIHLAGALGVPTWALVTFPSASYWRWFGQGSTTPWYASLQLLRHRAGEPWAPYFAKIGASIAKSQGAPVP